MAEENIDGSNFLNACLCKVQLPHTEEHAKVLPKPIMPTLVLPEENYSFLDPKHLEWKRVQALLADVDAARAEDLQLQRKFDKDADELLEAYKEGLKCTHWVPPEFEKSGFDENTARLTYELDHSNFQLAEVRNQLHTLKREMIAYERLVRQELGDNFNLHDVLTSTNRWRGRAQEIRRLKTEIADMETKAYSHKYLKNPLCIPTYKPRFPDVEDLVPRGQVQVLRNEARKKRVFKEKTEKEVNALLDQYGNISLMYKASLTHNKMLSEELRSIKEQYYKYEERARADRALIKNLISHQMHVREIVDRESHLARMVKQKHHEETDLEGEDVLDAVKYKALWEASESEKCTLEKMIETLNRRLEDIKQAAEEAERHCADNEAKRQEIEHHIEEAHEASQKVSKKKKEPKSRVHKALPPGVGPLDIEEKLEAVKEENRYLRDYLLKTIETKVEDLKLYQFTMNSIREQYVEKLHELNNPPPPPEPEPEPVVEAKPKKEKKKKKK